MAMGIWGVVMTDYDILSVFDSHLIHILLCQLHHKLIGQAWFVLRLETDGYVADRLANSWVQLRLDFEALGGDLRIVRDDAVVGNHFYLVFTVGVCGAASERGASYYFCYHCLLVYGFNYVRGMPDRVGHDDPSGIRVDHFCLFISLWR